MYAPYLDAVWSAFGDNRVIYGSNWPVSESAASYETLQRIAMEHAFSKGKTAAQRFCALNAKDAYKWIG
jgi:predicted TIM-barrel fold metal-dependent hydrolase